MTPHRGFRLLRAMLLTPHQLSRRPRAKLIDATYFLPEHGREAAGEFAAAHLPGAVHLDLATLADPDDPRPSTLPSAELFAARLGALGVTESDPIVVYDDSPLHSAARAWWMLRHFGAEDVAILDGGLAAWRAAGYATESGTPRPAPAVFTPRLRAGDTRDFAAVRADVDSGAEQIVDARSPARFAGSEPEHRPGVVPGHIPGSVNLHYARLFRPDGTWRSPLELAAAFADAGVDWARPVVATCGSGITACDLIVAAHLLGHDAALYDGSWSEWGADPTTPKAAG